MTSIFARPSYGSYSRVLESQKFWLWVIVLVGAGLRLYGLDFQSLWVDEGLQYFVATKDSVSEIVTQTNSFHPPLSFVINHAFLQMGESELYLRLPSALFGIASLPVFYILARKLTSGREAVLGVLVLAVSPFHIWYSQEGRMYSQLVFFSLLSSVLLIEALRRGELRWWIYYILASAAGVYTHVFMALGLMAQFLWVSLYHRRQVLAQIASGVVVFLLFLPWALLLPWVYRFFYGVGKVGLAVGRPIGSRAELRAGLSWENLPYTFFAYASGFSNGPTVAELHENRSFKFILQFAPEILLVATVFGALLVIGVFALYKSFGARSTVFCLLGFLAPVLGALVYALAPRATYNVRYSIVAFPYFCIVLGTGLAYLSRKNNLVGTVAVLAVLGISAMSLTNHFFNPRYAKEDVRSAVILWRSISTDEFLLSYKAYRVVPVYLRGAERDRHSRLRGDVVGDIQRFFSKAKQPSVYVVFARDWKRIKENAVRDVYGVEYERSYPGVRILRVSNSREHSSNGLRAMQ